MSHIYLLPLLCILSLAFNCLRCGSNCAFCYWKYSASLTEEKEYERVCIHNSEGHNKGDLIVGMYQLLRAHTKTDAGSLYEFVAFSDLCILTTNLLMNIFLFFWHKILWRDFAYYIQNSSKRIVNALAQDFIWICLRT